MKLRSFFTLMFAAGAVLAAAPASPAQPQVVDPMRQRRTAVVDVFQTCKDAVVNISSTQVIRVQTPSGINDLFDQLFDVPAPRQRTQELKRTSVGSGFVIHPAGYIVTNAHVVNRTADQKVTFPDGREFEAKVVATDPEIDLAVLKIEGDRPFNTLRLGRSADLMVGETVIAIGNPLGYASTVTAGVVSAIDREIQVSPELSFKALIQTDASINPGNSGGPLLNILGELIGINTAIRGDAQNIGFAIPVDHLRAALPELLDVERRYRVTSGMRVSPESLAQVAAVDDRSPAADAGVEAGDVIRRIDGQEIASGIDYHIALIGRKRGDALRLGVDRAGRAIDTTLTLAGRPRPDGAMLLSQRLGIRAEELTERAARQIGLPNLRGLLVTAVEDDSAARDVGLRRGDIIDQLGGYPAAGLDEVGEVLEKVREGQRVTLSVLRIQGRVLYRTQTVLPAR